MIPPSCFLGTFVTSFNIPAIIRWVFLKQTQKFQSTAWVYVTNRITHSTKLMMGKKCHTIPYMWLIQMQKKKKNLADTVEFQK